MTGTGTATTLRTKPGPGVHTDVPQRETCRPHLLRCPCARRPSAFSGSSQDPEPCTWQLECPRHNANVGHKGNRGTYDRLTQPHRDSRGGDSSRRWCWSLELCLKKEGHSSPRPVGARRTPEGRRRQAGGTPGAPGWEADMSTLNTPFSCITRPPVRLGDSLTEDRQASRGRTAQRGQRLRRSSHRRLPAHTRTHWEGAPAGPSPPTSAALRSTAG